MIHTTMVLDPGHGGHDPGAVFPLLGEPEVREKDINLEICRQVKRLLDWGPWPVSCELTRDLDEDLPTLTERGALASKFGADLVVSVHTNAIADPNVRGSMAFHCFDGDAIQVAAVILAGMPIELQRAPASVVEARPEDWTSRAYNVLSKHTVPAVLLEVGFLTSPRDRKLLSTASVRAGIAHAIVGGVLRYWQIRESRE